MRFATLILISCLAFAAAVQPAHEAGKARFPRVGQPGPWDSDLIVYHVSRGLEVTKITTFPRGGVPTLARLKDGRLIVAHQHFPENDEANFDKVAVHFSSDEG